MKRGITLRGRQLLFALTICLAAPLLAVPVVAEIEPNDTAPTATALDLNAGRAIASGAIRNGGDVDYFRFTASAGSLAWVLVDTGGTQQPGATGRDSVVDLLAADGSTLIESDDNDGSGTGGGMAIQSASASVLAGTRLVAGGTYYLRVRAATGAMIIDPYRLLLVISAGTVSNEVEANNSQLSAEPKLNAAKTVEVVSGAVNPVGDQDWFSHNAQAGDTLFVALDGDPNRTGVSTDFVLSIFDGAGSQLLTVDSSGSGTATDPAAEGVTFNVVTTGTYFVRIRPFNIAATGAYRLMLANMTRDDQSIMDIDGDGDVSSAIDGLILMRWLLGVRGPGLIGGIAFSGAATRTTVVAIESYLQAMETYARPW